jgi:energy-coupling factor transport system permease protein
MSTLASSRRIAYRRRASPLHAASAPVAAAYCLALATAALLTENPVLLGALMLAVLLAAGASGGVARDLLRSLRLSAPLMLAMIVIVNVIVTRGGLTVFARLGDWGVLGQVDLTVEAVVYGLVVTLRMFVVVLACLLAVCAADPDELLHICRRRISPHSALTATLATRLLPVLGEDARRVAEAQRCRPDGGVQGARGRLAVVRATVGGALERSLDVAAVLEMRGYGSTHRPARKVRRSPSRSRHDSAFLAAATALLAMYVLVAVGGFAPFSALPSVSLPVTSTVLLLACATVALALVPFANRRGIQP